MILRTLEIQSVCVKYQQTTLDSSANRPNSARNLSSLLQGRIFCNSAFPLLRQRELRLQLHETQGISARMPNICHSLEAPTAQKGIGARIHAKRTKSSFDPGTRTAVNKNAFRFSYYRYFKEPSCVLTQGVQVCNFRTFGADGPDLFTAQGLKWFP